MTANFFVLPLIFGQYCVPETYCQPVYCQSYAYIQPAYQYVQPEYHQIRNAGIQYSHKYVWIKLPDGRKTTIPVINGWLPQITEYGRNNLTLDYKNRIQYSFLKHSGLITYYDPKTRPTLQQVPIKESPLVKIQERKQDADFQRLQEIIKDLERRNKMLKKKYQLPEPEKAPAPKRSEEIEFPKDIRPLYENGDWVNPPRIPQPERPTY